MPPQSRVFHLVFLRFKPEHCTDEIALAGHEGAQELLLKIPGVTSARFGRNFDSSRADGFTHSLCVVFHDRHSFEGWGPSPLHSAWGSLHVAPYLDKSVEPNIVKIDMEAPVIIREDAGEMIDHTVFFTMRESFDKPALSKAVSALQSHILKIPGVLYATFGRGFLHKGPSEYALHVKFSSRSALIGYASHPLHRRWVNSFIKEHCSKARALDSASISDHSRL